MSLLVSGKHTLIILSHDLHKHEILASTLDDAIGEAYDKVAVMLKLAWADSEKCDSMEQKFNHENHSRVSAGQAVENAALKGDPSRFLFPIPMRNKSPEKQNIGFQSSFSFSGLKSAVKREIEKLTSVNLLDSQAVSDLAAGFQKAALLHIQDQLIRALDECLIHRGFLISALVMSAEWLVMNFFENNY